MDEARCPKLGEGDKPTKRKRGGLHRVMRPYYMENLNRLLARVMGVHLSKAFKNSIVFY